MLFNHWILFKTCTYYQLYHLQQQNKKKKVTKLQWWCINVLAVSNFICIHKVTFKCSTNSVITFFFNISFFFNPNWERDKREKNWLQTRLSNHETLYYNLFNYRWQYDNLGVYYYLILIDMFLIFRGKII